MVIQRPEYGCETDDHAIYAAPARPPVNHPWPFLGSPMAVPWVVSGVRINADDHVMKKSGIPRAVNAGCQQLCGRGTTVPKGE